MLTVREVSETTPSARFHMDENKSYVTVDKAESITSGSLSQRTAPASDGSKNVLIALVMMIVLVVVLILAVAACCMAFALEISKLKSEIVVEQATEPQHYSKLKCFNEYALSRLFSNR